MVSGLVVAFVVELNAEGAVEIEGVALERELLEGRFCKNIGDIVGMKDVWQASAVIFMSKVVAVDVLAYEVEVNWRNRTDII